ncbi:hypothetical protein HMPREF7545_1242 [Selenomonas noxia ATCC 43541]|nr:hypothetical protein HMPREF7545_1242 [Selenomonas noxia ATCC 43541]
MNIPHEEDKAQLAGGEILFGNGNAACRKTAGHESAVHRGDQFIDLAQREFSPLIGTGSAFEEAKALRLMLDRDVRDMKANTLIGGEIRGGRGRRNDLRTLLVHTFLSFSLLRTRLIQLLLLRGRSGRGRKRRE